MIDFDGLGWYHLKLFKKSNFDFIEAEIFYYTGHGDQLISQDDDEEEFHGKV